MTLKSDTKFEGKVTSGLKKDMRIWQIFTRALESVKIGTLMGSFWPKGVGLFQISHCGPLSLHYCTLPKKTFPLQFRQEEHISENSVERRV